MIGNCELAATEFSAAIGNIEAERGNRHIVFGSGRNRRIDWCLWQSKRAVFSNLDHTTVCA